MLVFLEGIYIYISYESPMSHRHLRHLRRSSTMLVGIRVGWVGPRTGWAL